MNATVLIVPLYIRKKRLTDDRENEGHMNEKLF